MMPSVTIACLVGGCYGVGFTDGLGITDGYSPDDFRESAFLSRGLIRLYAHFPFFLPCAGLLGGGVYRYPLLP